MGTPIDGTSGTNGGDPDDGQIQQGSSSSVATQQTTETSITSSTHSASATLSAAATATQSITATKHDSTPYSAGDLAGGIIGAALGAALLTCLVMFLLSRKGRSRRSISHTSSKSHASGPVTFIDEQPAIKLDRSNAPWQVYLRQSADDRVVRTEIRSLFDQVELHVENFYRKASIVPDANLATKLEQVDSGRLPLPIAELIQSSRLSREVIKHIIASALVTGMSPIAGSGSSLLPAHLQMVPTKLDPSTLRSQEAPAARQAYSEWKRLNYYLCPHPEEDPFFVEERARKVNHSCDILNTALSPWRAQGDENTFRQHERALFTQASNVAIKLMSQSWDYDFVWNESSNIVGDAIVKFPGLLKTTDEGGRLLPSGQMLVPSVVMDI